MKNFILVMLLMSCLKTALAQQDTMRISLTQAIEYGLKNRYDMQASNLNIDIANNQTNLLKKNWLPDISGSGNARYNTRLPSTVVPPGFGGGTTERVVQLGTKNNTYFSLDLSQAIYQPGLQNDIVIAANNTELEKEKNEQNKRDVRFTIAQAYFNVLLKQLLYTISKESENRYKEYYEIALEKFQIGTLIESDFLKAKLDYKNAKIATVNANQDYTLSANNLKYLLNISSTTSLTLVDNLNVPTTLNDLNIESGTGENRTEIKQLRIQQIGNHLQVRKANILFLPTISFIANYTTQFQANNFEYFTKMWYPYNYLGFKMSLPITGSIKNSNVIRDGKLKAKQTEFNLKQKIADIDYEIHQTKTNLMDGIGNLQTAKENYELSKEVYELQKQQYLIGAVLYSTVLDTQNSLNIAEQNYVNAVFNYLVAKLNYEKAINKFIN